jgi:hypothetical protein
MIDMKCYNCIINPDKFDDLDGDYSIDKPKYSIYKYEENGIFKCPRCGHILDKNNNIYTIIVQRKYDECGELETEILEVYSETKKIKENEKDGFEQDMYELAVFEDLSPGIYKFDVLWYYYECGGYEGTEWDVEIKVLSKEDIDIDKFKDKQKHLRLWRDYNRDRIYTKLIQDINEKGI